MTLSGRAISEEVRGSSRTLEPGHGDVTDLGGLPLAGDTADGPLAGDTADGPLAGDTADGSVHRPRLRQSPYPSLVGEAMFRAAQVRTFLWDRALRDVKGAQLRQLARIVKPAERTLFGRDHDFAGVRTYEDFRARVPVGDYDSFSPFIDRMRAGEKNLLVPEFIEFYGNSSGSSVQGKQKFLPVSERQIRFQQLAGGDGFLRYLSWSKDVSFFSGYTMGLFPPITMRREGSVFITSNPALMATRMPLLSRPVYLPDDATRAIADYDRKLETIARIYLDHDVRAVTGTTCWFTVLFEKVLAEARRRGRRARTIRDVWPNLRVLFGGGVSAAPYLPILEDFFGSNDFTLVDTYNATEGGIYGSSDFSGERGLLVSPHRGVFYEFVPLDEAESKHPSRVPLWAVEKDKPYVILVSTVSGLYAYKLGDIVRFPSVAPHRIEFMGRLSGCLSVTQELTTHVEIERAVAFAKDSVPCTPIDFGAAADVGVDGTAKSRYVLFVEFRDGHAPSDLDAFARAFDEGLCRENRVYREHRNGEVAILPPRVLTLVPGGAKSFLGQVTNGNVQGKFPRILNDARKHALLPFTTGAADGTVPLASDHPGRRSN